MKNNLADDQHSLEGLNLVNAVLRLGIDYHFQDEIEAILKREYLIFNGDMIRDCNTQDLYEIALRFRLLRQGGYYVSPGIYAQNIF